MALLAKLFRNRIPTVEQEKVLPTIDERIAEIKIEVATQRDLILARMRKKMVNLYLNLISQCPEPVAQVTILIRLVGGPLDGDSLEIRLAEAVKTTTGAIWKAKWRENVLALYAFETPPELAWHLGETRHCWAGRFVGWEKTNA